MKLFENINHLCSNKDAFDFNKKTEELFFQSMKENYVYQLENQEFVRFLSKKFNFNTDKLNSPEDIYNIPPIFVGILKYHKFCNIPDEKLALTLTSSGTSGQKTQLLLNEQSLKRLNNLAYSTFSSLGYKDNTPVHYIIVGYDRTKAEQIGTSWSDEQNMQYAPKKSVHWTIKWDEENSNFTFDYRKVAELFIELSSDAPVRLIGFPAFIYQMVQQAVKLKNNIQVDPRSFLIAGGGWKNHEGKQMTHREFSEYIEKSIALPVENIRDAYGMAEHGIPYASCSKGFHHVPIFGRLAVLDPVTLKRKPNGEEGLLSLFTPYNTTQPNLSILSTDIVTLNSNCSCGIKGDYIQSIRRGGKKKHKGCAIAAQEILNKSRNKPF